eukprot:Skav207845  [mRNA]  locus=scaffold3025:248728:251809:- [translate_table: standard]
MRSSAPGANWPLSFPRKVEVALSSTRTCGLCTCTACVARTAMAAPAPRSPATPALLGRGSTGLSSSCCGLRF